MFSTQRTNPTAPRAFVVSETFLIDAMPTTKLKEYPQRRILPFIKFLFKSSGLWKSVGLYFITEESSNTSFAATNVLPQHVDPREGEVRCTNVVQGIRRRRLGSGGGVVAAVLANAGYKVLVLEKGSYSARNNVSLLEGPSMDQMYLSNGLVATNDMFVLILAASTVGDEGNSKCCYKKRVCSNGDEIRSTCARNLLVGGLLDKVGKDNAKADIQLKTSRSTGVSNPNMCPHCVVQDLTRLRSSDSVVLVARPQYGSWKNARLLANDGRGVDNNLVLVNIPQKHSSKAKQLHRGTNDIVRYKETKWAAECAKAQVEAELSNAKQTVKDLFSMIGESMYKAKAEMRDMAPLNKYVKPRNDDNQYSQVMTKLEHAKRELFQLKLHVGSVLEEKLQAENKVKASRSNMLSFSRVAQKQTNEIEEASEEQLVVQLDKMDALNELRDIEQLQNTRNKLKEAIEAIDETKELEMKLATTLSDIDMLKNDFKFVNKMGKRLLQRSGQSIEHIEKD
ncbi:hypothetical protein JHK82_035213 [Glycine max]|nr:hypothetical protein JHK82_035213 [Glycine max]